MNARGRNGPFFIKTYSKQMRKVEPWFSPKAVFSLSSTASSDQSISDSTRPKKRRMKTTASRPAKRKAMIALKEKESDEENCAPSPPSSSFRRKTNAKQSVKTTAAIKTRTKKKKKRNIQSILSSSENEDDSFMMKKSHPKTSEKECTNVNKVLDPPLLSRFVTHRKRPPAPTQAQKHTSKPNSVALHHTLNSSDDFHPSFSRNKHLASRKTITQHRYSNNPVIHKNRKLSQLRVALGEVSFNDSDDQNLSCKRPLLSSTPSLVCRPLQRLPEPSISEISSLSCDELCQPAKINISALGLRNIKSSDPTSQEESRQQLSKQTGERGMEQREAVEETAGDGERDQRTGECAGGVSSPSHTGPPSPLQSLAEQLKERCCTVAVSVMLNRINISDHLSEQNCSRKQEEEMLSNYVESSVTRADHSNQTHASVSSSFHSLTKPSLTSKRLSTSSITEPSCSVQALIDRLKAECLLSCLTVGVPRLDFGACPAVHQGAAKAPCTDSPNHRDASTRCSDSSDKSPINLRAPNTNMVVRRLSASFQPSLASPPASAAPSKTRPPAAGKERAGAGTSTGRKVCVSGLNVSRWTKRDTGEFNAKRRKKEGQMKGVSGDYSSWSSLMSAGADAHAGDSVCGWLQGGSGFGLAVTPLRMEQMNLSSILANFTPDTLTTHSWGRLKAALSLHKKKTAFPTPRRLVQSPGSRFPADSSLDLFASPVRTSLCRLTPSRLLRSAINTPRTVYEDDISDAEKVYQECQQNGPLSFSDCIPPSRMKLCSKIGEGTFGEVFSTVNDSNQTVALKIIPVEGSQRVNGEQQKSFGEILHEIIISKELSSLNLKDINKSDGFIGLNDLHCVRGRYPEALLKAWDKFDRQKGSENDRPDFFDDEQLFLILEFEFGGSDLENMNGKLSSMAQAISVLHQVTAALAVAEQELHFEHRDLHWGNILVNNTKQKQCEFILNGELHSIETRGVHVNIIDYSLSRLEIDGLTVSCDISADDELFMGQGDYQFEIYRLMKKENNNCWATYNPHSNVLWLHYLADKLMSMSYRAKAQSSQQRTLKSSLKSFQSEILNYTSATDALRNCRFFQ